MTTPIHVTVFLFINDGERDAFERFERAVKPEIERYGGRFAAVGQITQQVGFDSAPDEVHWLTFPSQEAFDAYRGRVVSAELQTLRARAIHQTFMTISVPTYYLD